MPKARMVLAAVTYLVTRRTSQRFFRFPPGDPVVKQIFEYAVAYAAGETGVRVHAWILMSNHFHIVATDVRGEAPLFYQLLDRQSAEAALSGSRSRALERVADERGGFEQRAALNARRAVGPNS